MYYTSATDYGIKDSAGKFQLGYVNQIAGWNFDTGKLYNTNAILSSTGYASFGTTPPTTYGNNVGAWIGYSTSDSKAKLSLYSDSSNYMQWNGSSLSVGGGSISGGSISGTTISASTVYSGKFTTDSSAYTGSSTFASIWDTTGSDPVICASYYGSLTNQKYVVVAPKSASTSLLYAYARYGANSSSIEFAFDNTTNVRLQVLINGAPAQRWRGSSISATTIDVREGDMYYNTSNSKIYIYANSSWVLLN
jgi:hypothetical protein